MAPVRSAPDVVAGSHDPLLDWAIRQSGSGLATLFDGSMDGVERLASGQASAAGLHVFEPETGDWNLGLTERHFGGSSVVLIEWARRQQGLILAPNLTGKISTVSDLRGRRIAMRQQAAGAAVLFNHLVDQASLSAEEFQVMPEVARTETEAAVAVASD